MTFLWQQHPHIVIVFLALSLLTALSNYSTIRRFDQYPLPRSFPRVSVLVPARNEAGNIVACITSLLAQDYPEFQVLVLDDHSTDDTLPLLAQIARSAPRLRVLSGSPLPAGWLGKHWACAQLARAADGELLLFTDADTRHRPDMLRDSTSALLAEGADLVTAFPREEVVSLGEKLVVPVMSFGIFSFLPLRLARWLRWPSLSVSIGQFMLFRRAAFEAIGGYEAVRDHLVDDVALGRRIIATGREWRLLDGTAHVTCRMYGGFWEAVEGFSKNVFAFFEYRLPLYALAWFWVTLAFIEPPFTLLAQALGRPWPWFPHNLATIAVAESLLLWTIAYRRFRLPAWLALLYPISLSLFVLIALRSLVLTVTGQVMWKGRSLARQAFRW